MSVAGICGKEKNGWGLMHENNSNGDSSFVEEEHAELTLK